MSFDESRLNELKSCPGLDKMSEQEQIADSMQMEGDDPHRGRREEGRYSRIT